MSKASIGLIGLLLVSAVAASAGDTVPECSDNPRMRALDFWVGEWEVLQGDTRVGTNKIDRVLKGCALTEAWRDSQGGEGRSLFFFDASNSRWKQVWVTDRALRMGGVKEKLEEPEFTAPGRIRFRGAYRGTGPGVMVEDRTTLSREPDGSVRQLIEISTDGGRKWKPVFDARYVRVASSGAAPK